MKKFKLYLTTLIAVMVISFVQSSSLSMVIEEKNKTDMPMLVPGQEESPQYASGEVLLKVKEGVSPEDVLKEVTIQPKELARVHSIKSVVAKYKKTLKETKLEKDKEGWYWFLGKKYKEVQDIPNEELFQQAYQQMSPTEKALYRTYKLVLPEAISVEEAVDKLKSNPNVEYAEPNYIYKPLVSPRVPNDPRYSEQWAHQKIQSEQAWGITMGSSDVIIAIIDTGVDYTHEDLRDNIWINADEIPNNGMDDDNNGYVDDIYGYDFGNNDSDPMDDDSGHGTHTSGIADAVSDNNIGIAGTSWTCKIMAVKIFGEGESFASSAASALFYAVDNGADILSNSWGSGGHSQTLKDAIDYAHSQNAVIVFAAGNTGSSSAVYPAVYENVIAVSATDRDDNTASFSTYGSWVDVAAPGKDILSTIPLKFDPSGYYIASGTSMACPHVAGLAGLILSHHPEFTNEQIRRVLQQSADVPGIDMPMQDRYIGTGRINAYKALQVDNVSNATCHITSPAEGSIISGKINIEGTATDDNFISYTIYYGQQGYPGTWNQIYTSTAPVINGVLYSNFDTTILNDGESISFKVKVIDSDGLIAEAITSVSINNVESTGPLNNDIFRLGDIIDIRGSVHGDTLIQYVIEYETCENPGQWFTQGIVLTDGGVSPVNNGLLATWDTSSMTQSGFYTLRITANYPTIQTQEFIRNIFLDPTLKAGWPQRFDWDPAESGGHYWAGYLQPAAADINNDGVKELIFYKAGWPPKVVVFAHDGSILDGWPVNIGAEPVSDLPAPVIGDINNDGFEDIIIYSISESKLYAFKYNGSILNGWPVILPKNPYPTLSMADLDLDGNKEIIFKGSMADPADDTEQQKMLIISKNGEIISQWALPQPDYYSQFAASPAVGNFDDDPELEIVSASPSENTGYDEERGEYIYEGVIYIYNQDGSIVNGWPVYTDGVIDSSPVIGDVNKDGELEIIIGLKKYIPLDNGPPHYAYNGGVYIFDKNGNILPGWPVLKDFNFVSPPSLADFDGDDDLEICINSKDYETHIIHHDGTIAQSWQRGSGRYSMFEYNSITVGDINGDNIPDIITPSGSGMEWDSGGVHAWNFNGTIIEGFPKVTECDAWGSAVISDIDNDGKLELMASSLYDYLYDNYNYTSKYKMRSSIYVWEIPYGYNQSTMHWPTFQHDNQRTGLYASPGYILRLDSMPYYEKERPVYSAAACSKMVLDYIREDSVLTQTELHEYIEPTSSRDLTADEVMQALQHYKPWQYNFATRRLSTINDALRDICHWIDYEVPGVNRPNTPAVIPSYGGYNNWMVVRGFATDKDPQANNHVWRPQEFTVYGFWLNDPAVDGIGENTYKRASELESTYFLPLNTDDYYNGYYVYIAEPPEVLSNAKVKIAEPVINANATQALHRGQMISQPGVQGFDILNIDSESFDWRGIVDPVLLNDDNFMDAIKDTHAIDMIKVNNLTNTGDYYLVPFTKSNSNEVKVVLLIDAYEGYFKEASWVKDPTKYLNINEQDAINLLNNRFNIAPPQLNPELVWEPGEYSPSPFQPFWIAIVKGKKCYVTQEGKVYFENNTPVLNTIGDKSIDEGKNLSFVISATDQDADELTYSADNLPRGANFSGNRFTWTPGYEQAGEYEITFTVSDSGLSDSEAITITVINVNRPPVAKVNVSPTEGKAPLRVRFKGSDSYDPDGDKLTYLWNFGDTSSASNGGSSTEADPVYTYKYPGIYKATLKATDPYGLSSEVSVNIVVKKVNTPPTIVYIHNYANLWIIWYGWDKEDKWGINYSYRIDNGRWSVWSRISRLYIPGLRFPPGWHTIYVKARDSQGVESQIKSCRFYVRHKKYSWWRR